MPAIKASDIHITNLNLLKILHKLHVSLLAGSVGYRVTRILCVDFEAQSETMLNPQSCSLTIAK